MSAAPRIMRFRWDGRAMVPLHPGIAARQYEAGETYRLEAVEERSIATHNHYFATIREGWNNLSDERAAQFPTPDHLRKYLLIKTGYRDERSISLASKAEALRVAAFVEPSDGYAVVTSHEATVFIYTARSQSTRAMGAKEFRQSKNDTLDELARMLEVDRRVLEANAGKAA